MAIAVNYMLFIIYLLFVCLILLYGCNRARTRASQKTIEKRDNSLTNAKVIMQMQGLLPEKQYAKYNSLTSKHR